jgi:signal transduction histidine kinase
MGIVMPENKIEEKGNSGLTEMVFGSTAPLSENKLSLLKYELLKKIDLFNALPEHTLEVIALESSDLILKEGDVLFEEGVAENIMYIILSGELLICKGIQAKKRIAVLGAGEYVGEMALIDHQPRSASATALSETMLMKIPESLFREHIASNPDALLEMMKVFSFRIRKDLDSMASDMQRISNFTHDMRNCLVPLGLAEVLLTDVVNSLKGTTEYHKARQGWEKVSRTYKTMLAVRNNLITLIDQSLACVKKTKSTYVKAELEVLPLIRETVDEICCHKHLKGKEIKVSGDESLKTGFFNSLDIKRVLQNLLINAGYVTKKEGHINVNIKDLNDSIQVSVKDFGCGIPEEIKTILLKETYTTKSDGNGFGLMSCKEIIEDFHQGKIFFESEVGKGTTFHFTIAHAN